MMMKLFLALVFCLMAATAFAGTNVTFEWDANTEPDLAGYRLYQATSSGDYGNQVGSTLVGIETVTLQNILSGTYFWVLTAYDTNGNESAVSNEITATLDSQGPAAPKGLKITIKVIVEVEK